MENRPLERKGEKDRYTPLSTEYNHIHSRTLEEFPEGPYGSAREDVYLGKTSGWDSGEEVNPRYSYENEQLHEATQRLDETADPIRKYPEGHLE